jgi:hypothetical protein
VLTGMDDTTQITNNVAGFLENIFSSCPVAIKETDWQRIFNICFSIIFLLQANPDASK